MTFSYASALTEASSTAQGNTPNGTPAQGKSIENMTGTSQSSSAAAVVAPSEHQILFAKAAMITFDLWPALRLAVTEEWGGPESKDKADFLLNAVCDFFDEFTPTQRDSSLRTPDQDELLDLLESYMSYEYNVRLEDGSMEYVAQRLLSLWNTIFVKGTDAGKEAIRNLEEAQAKLRGKSVSAQAEKNEEEEEEEWGDEEGEEEEGSNQRSNAHQSAVDDSMEVDTPEHSKPREPVVDEDGFTLVSSSSRRRR